VDSAYVRTTAVAYTLGETVSSGQFTWTWEENAGVTDNESPHAQALTGAELNAGTHSGLLTNAPSLVQAAAYAVQFIAVDAAGNADTLTIATVTYDTLAPGASAALVSDGPAADIDSTRSTDTLDVHWSGFSEPTSGIVLYEYALGTTSGGSNVISWTSNGTDTLVSIDQLQLAYKRTYYFMVRAADGAGNLSDSVSSDGVRIVDKPRLTVNAVQNTVFSDYLQVFINDTLGMADSVRLLVDSVSVSTTEIDTFVYVGTHKLTTTGAHTITVTGISGLGDTIRTASLSMALAKMSQSWVAASVDQLFKMVGTPGSVSEDRYLLVVDSALMGVPGADGTAYRSGDGHTKFHVPVQVSMRPAIHSPGSPQEQAIYILRSNDRWEELPTLDEGDLVTAWVNSTGTFRLGPRSILVPVATSLHQNYPNPFNPSTRIVFDLGFRDGPSQRAVVAIYNLRGQKVRTLYNGDTPAGQYNLVWHGVDDRGATVASGVYFVRLSTHLGYEQTRKMLLLR
jgi:hypothetical protein